MKATTHAILTTILSSCIFPLLAFTQTKPFEGGVFFNANGIHITGDNKDLWQSSKNNGIGGGGISAGISVKHILNKNLYFNLELRYIQKGGIYSYSNDYGTQSWKVMRLNYLEIPLMIGIKFQKKKRDLYLETGPGYAQLFSSKYKIDEFAERNDNPEAANFKKQDLSWIGCIKFPINQKGKKNLLFGFRFSYSIFPIHTNYKVRNMVYGIQLDYLFDI